MLSDVCEVAEQLPVPAVRTVESVPSVNPSGQIAVALTVNDSVAGTAKQAFVADVVR